VIEWLQFGDVLYLLGKVMASTVASLILIGIAEMLMQRKGQFRTNAG